MVWNKRIQNNQIPTFDSGGKVRIGKNGECIDTTSVVVETSSDGLFLKPIILVENGLAKATKYHLRRTRKGMLRLE